MIRALLIVLLFSMSALAQVVGNASLTVQQAGQSIVPNVWWSDMETSEQRNLNLSGAICLPFAQLSGNPGGRCTDTGGQSSIWTGFEKMSGGGFVTGSNCRNGSGTCYQATMNQVGGGDYSVWVLGNHPTGNASLSGNPPANLYSRAFWRFPASFEPGDGCRGGKFMYIRDVYGDDGNLFMGPLSNADFVPGSHFILGIQTYGGGTPTLNWGCNVGSCNLPLDNQYHAVEVHVDVASNRVRMWIDDNLVFDRTGIIPFPNMQINQYSFGFYNDVDGSSCAPPSAQNFWIDSPAISTTRIGQ